MRLSRQHLISFGLFALMIHQNESQHCGSRVIFDCAKVDHGGFCLSSNSSLNSFKIAKSLKFYSGNITFVNNTLLTPKSGPRCLNSDVDENCCGDPCKPNPCLNNGTCTISSHQNETFSCICSSEFRGDWCHIPVPQVVLPCIDCDLNAACVNGECVCKAGYMGDGTFCIGRCEAISVTAVDLYHTKCGNQTINFNESYEGHTQESNEKCQKRAMATIDCTFGSTVYDKHTLLCIPCSETMRVEPVSMNTTAAEVEGNITNIALLTTEKNKSVSTIRECTAVLKSLAHALKYDQNSSTGEPKKKEISTKTMKHVLTIVNRLVSELSPGDADTPALTEDSLDKLPEESERDSQIRKETRLVTELVDDFARSVNMSGKEKIDIFTDKTALQIVKPKEKPKHNHDDIYFRTTSLVQPAVSGNIPQRQPPLEMRIPGTIVRDMENHVRNSDPKQQLKLVFAAFRDASHLTGDRRTGPVVEACFRPGACSLGANFESNFAIHYQDPPVPTTKQKRVVFGKNLKLHLEYFCVHWDTTTDSWSQSGCHFVNNTEFSAGLNYSCQCNHFTSFSILLRTTTELANYEMHYYCLVLCFISALLLIITAIIHLSVRELRIRRPTPILVNICLNLAIGFILFVIGIDGRMRGFSEDACLVFAVLMHLAFLFSWFWMLVYSLNLYHSLIKVVGSPSIISNNRFMYLCGYLIPAAIVFVDVGISTTLDRQPKRIAATSYESHYIASNVCWIRSLSMYFAFAAPIGVILVVNFIIFFLVMRKLTWKKDPIRSTREKTTISQQMFIAIALCCTMGLTWIFGYLMLFSSDPRYHDTMELVFNVFNTSQGVVIFFICCLKQKAVRKLWLYPLCRLCGCTEKTKEGGDSDGGNPDVSESRATLHERSTRGTTAL